MENPLPEESGSSPQYGLQADLVTTLVVLIRVFVVNPRLGCVRLTALALADGW